MTDVSHAERGWEALRGGGGGGRRGRRHTGHNFMGLLPFLDIYQLLQRLDNSFGSVIIATNKESNS